MDHIPSVAAERSEERTIAVHYDEAKLLIRFEQLAESFCVEFVVAEIKGCVDRFEGLKVHCIRN